MLHPVEILIEDEFGMKNRQNSDYGKRRQRKKGRSVPMGSSLPPHIQIVKITQKL